MTHFRNNQVKIAKILKLDDFIVGCKLRKYCHFHILEAWLVSALSELFRAELQRQVGLPMIVGTTKDVPQYIGKYASEHRAGISFHPCRLA